MENLRNYLCLIFNSKIKLVEMAGEYLKSSTIYVFFPFSPYFLPMFTMLTVRVLRSQDCQCSIYLYPRKSRKPRQAWFTLHRKITQDYRTVFTQSQPLEKSMANVSSWTLVICIYIISFQEVWWDYTVQSALDSGIRWPFLQIFQGFSLSCLYTAHWHLYQKVRKRS